MTHISGGILPPWGWNSFPPWAKLDASCVHFPLCRRPWSWFSVSMLRRKHGLDRKHGFWGGQESISSTRQLYCHLRLPASSFYRIPVSLIETADLLFTTQSRLYTVAQKTTIASSVFAVSVRVNTAYIVRRVIKRDELWTRRRHGQLVMRRCGRQLPWVCLF